jgi:hypothetical protein
MPDRIIPAPPPPPPPDEAAVPASNAAAVTVPSAPEPTQPEGPPTALLNVPTAFAEFLFTKRYSDSSAALRDEFKFTDEDVVFVGDLDRMVMAGEIDGEVYVTALEDEFKTKMGDETFNRFLARLVADRLLPLGDAVKPSAQEIAKTHGLTLPVAPHYSVYTKPLSYSAAAGEVAAMAGFSIMGGPIRERLRELLLSKVKGVRTDLQVRDVLTRGLDFGGVGLDPKAAEAALAAMNDILGRAKVLSEDEYGNWLADEARKKATPAVPQPTASSQGTTEDEEIERMKGTMQKPTVDASSELGKSVAATLDRLSYKPTDEYLAKRLQSNVSSRLRDVRGQIEFRQLLMRPVKVGGLGLEAAQADEVASQVERSYKEFHDTIESEEKRKITQQLEDQKHKIEERRGRESEEHAKWFEEKIRSRKAGETETQQTADAMRKLMSVGPVSPIDMKETRLETAKFGPLIPADAAKPTGIKVSPPTAEIAKAAAAAKPTLDAVKYAGPQLMGLVGELKTLTVAEFRRMAKDPQAAAQKILQKIETLGQESFEKRVDGMRSFQGSPLQAAYMALVTESFRTAKPVAALAEEKRAAGQDTLSPDEIAAVMKINSALHF